MKKLFYIVKGGCLILASFQIQSQTSPNLANQPKQVNFKKQHQKLTPEQRAQKSVDELNKIVGLSEEQKKKVYELALNRAKSVDAVIEKYMGQQDKKKEVAKQEIYQIKKQYNGCKKYPDTGTN
jgi:DNA-directed RNA polymerase subunit F